MLGDVVTFDAAIPGGVSVVEVRVPVTLAIGAPADDSVSTVKLQNLAVTTSKLAAQAVTADKLDNNAVESKLPAGVAVKTTRASLATVTTGTTTIPSDDTMPLVGEGFQVLSLNYVPKNAASTLRVDVTVVAAHGAGAAAIIVGLFQPATDSRAVAATQSHSPAANAPVAITFSAVVSAADPNFTVRVGSPTAGTVTVNGASGLRLLGGTMVSSITVTEFKA